MQASWVAREVLREDLVDVFAAYQPFTPITETRRGLLGAPATSDVIAALAWCARIALDGYLWASSTFRKRP